MDILISGYRLVSVGLSVRHSVWNWFDSTISSDLQLGLDVYTGFWVRLKVYYEKVQINHQDDIYICSQNQGFTDTLVRNFPFFGPGHTTWSNNRLGVVRGTLVGIICWQRIQSLEIFAVDEGHFSGTSNRDWDFSSRKFVTSKFQVKIIPTVLYLAS